MVSYEPRPRTGGVWKTLVVVALIGATIAFLSVLKQRQQQATAIPVLDRPNWILGTTDLTLRQAIDDNDYEAVRQRLSESPKPPLRDNIIARLAMDSRVNALRAFLDSGWSAKGKNADNAPLLTSTKLNQVKAAELLLSRGADPDKPDSAGSTPLVSCCRVPGIKLAVIETLLDHGADVGLPSTEQMNVPNLRRFVPRGSGTLKPNATAHHDLPIMPKLQTLPIEAAIASRRPDIVRLLVKRGATFDVERFQPEVARLAGFESSFHQRWEDAAPTIEVLLELGCKADARSQITLYEKLPSGGTAPKMIEGTPLFAAVFAKNDSVAMLLLRHGADPHAKASDGRTPLDIDPSLIDRLKAAAPRR